MIRGQVPDLSEPASFSLPEALSLHWPEFLIEAFALGMFMISASVVTTLLVHPGALLNRAIGSGALRLSLIGISMGGTAVALIYSPWGRRSGAHMNPAVTLAFLCLRRISAVNAALYVAAQFAGGYAGVLLSRLLLGGPFTAAPVDYIVTVPGPPGAAVAFAAEFAISFVMMFTILMISNEARWSRYTGVAAGILISGYVFFESPLSGFSMNPARTFASALPANEWRGIWIYFTAPVAAMWLAARAFHVLTPWSERLHHLPKIVPTRAR
jgi:aquaporin Z